MAAVTFGGNHASDAFSPASSSFGVSRSIITTRSCKLNMLLAGGELGDPHATAVAVQDVTNFLSSTSSFLADATSTVTGEVAAEAAEKSGWWQTYLDTLKNVLIFIHGAIDQPLRDAGITQTWGIAIALFTAGIRSALIPLSIQQSKSAEYIKALKPYQDEIKEKFADKKEVMNRAIAKLYEDAGTNPLSGCLISILQLPVFLGLYRSVTLLAKEGQLNEPFLWIPSLEGPVSPPTYRGIEWLTEGWTKIDGVLTPSLGWETTIAFIVMPIILVLGQSLTMSVLQPPVDEDMSDEDKEQFERSQLVLKFLPLLIGYFSLQVPAGLTIYWLTSNTFTLAQSLAVRAYYNANPPQIELPEYWDALDDVANMTPEERRAAAEAGISAGPSFDDLLDEARFHYLVKRVPLRKGSDAWERAQNTKNSFPEEISSWVSSSAAVSSEKEAATA